MSHNMDARLIHFVRDNCDFVSMWLLAYMFLLAVPLASLWSVMVEFPGQYHLLFVA